MKTILFLAGAIALAGCQNGGVGMAESPAWFATATPEQQMAYFSKRCAAYGFKPTTDLMAQCLMSETQSSRSGARLQAMKSSQSISNAGARMSANSTRSRMVTTNCNRYGNSVTCNSY